MSQLGLKGTIVRMRPKLVRLAFRSGDWVAPNLAGRMALRLWLTVPQARPAVPLPAGGTPFIVYAGEAALRGHVWGDGPVVYFAHGWGGCANQFGAYVEPLMIAGYRVVLFDGPSHGQSDPGRLGPRQCHELELSESLDTVCAQFGPAHAIVAHSLGAIATYFALRRGRTSAKRLVLLAPLVESDALFDRFRNTLGLGPRTQRAMQQALVRVVGLRVEESDARRLAPHLGPIPTLVVHDRGDRQMPHASAADLVARLPAAQLVSTDGLGHRRILQDPSVVQEVLGFLRAEQPLPAGT